MFEPRDSGAVFLVSFSSSLRNRNKTLCFCLLLSGGHVARPLAAAAVQEEGEGRSWESRHLLQEVVFYGNDSRIYTKPEKNCTEPGRTEQNIHVGNAGMDVIGWKVVSTNSKDIDLHTAPWWPVSP